VVASDLKSSSKSSKQSAKAKFWGHQQLPKIAQLSLFAQSGKPGYHDVP